jgi:hypothetical protein
VDATPSRETAQDFCVSIGNVALELRLQDEELRSAAEKRYAVFAGEAERRPQAIEVIRARLTNSQQALFAGEFAGARVEAEECGVRFHGVRNEYELDSLLRMYLSWELLSRTGFLLHAATVLRNGHAYVFTGKSGAGKSTVVSLSPAGSALTDEISLLRKKDGVWRAYGTPFWGEFRSAGSNESAPVAGIFRLVQAARNRVTSLRSAKLLRTLLPNVLFFSPEVHDQRRLLEITSAASQEIPGYTLEFRKEASFWEVLP